mgnify:CR=1 FL=1
MNKIRRNRTLVGMLALITACSMFSGWTMAEEAADVPEAIIGAWKLYQVMELRDEEEPVLIPEEEEPSLYGIGINIYNFDDSGVIHHITIADGESISLNGFWETTGEHIYDCREDAGDMTVCYLPEDDMLHRTGQEAGRDLEFIYARAFVGSWKLSRIQLLIEGDAPIELSREETPYLFDGSDSVLVVNPDGSGMVLAADGSEEDGREGSWTSSKPNYFIFTEGDFDMGFTYFSSNDAIFRDVLDESGDSGYSTHLRYTYERVSVQADAAQTEEPDTQAQDVSDTQTQDVSDTQADTQTWSEAPNGNVYQEEPAYEPEYYAPVSDPDDWDEFSYASEPDPDERTEPQPPAEGGAGDADPSGDIGADTQDTDAQAPDPSEMEDPANPGDPAGTDEPSGPADISEPGDSYEPSDLSEPADLEGEG